MRVRDAPMSASRSATCLALLCASVASAAPLPEAAAALVEQRAAIAFNLSHPIAECVARRDTEHPAFHGCIDWHSAVHGTWALIAYQRATGDARYAALVASTLDPNALDAERRYLREHPDFEMPYGRAWFLRLALEHARATNSTLLQPMGDEVAQSLVARYTREPPALESSSYGSASWALINLHDYARARGDATTIAFVVAQVRARFLDGVARCRAPDEAPEFMAVCSNVLWLVAKTLPPAEVGPWLARHAPLALELAPITAPRRAHEYGKNFSRAWGLWGLYQVTGDPRWAEHWARHIVAGYRDPRHWAGDYHQVAHWVAQFGMFALQPTFEPMDQ